METNNENPPSLPILLISAAEDSVASTIISELMNGSQSEDYPEGCVWVLSNKYYTARVLIRSHLDGERPPPQDVLERVEAHVIYVNNNKGEDMEMARRRFASYGDMPLCQIKLLIADDDDNEEMTAWAWQNGLEPIWRQSGEVGEDIDRAKDALHAHCWSGFNRNNNNNDNIKENNIDLFATLAEMRDLPTGQRLLLAEMAMLHLQELLED